MPTILDRLSDHQLTAKVIFPSGLRELLSALVIKTGPIVTPQVETGTVDVGYSNKPLGFFDLQFTAPIPGVPYRLELDGNPPSAFRLYLQLSAAEPAERLFGLLEKAPAFALNGAAVDETNGLKRLKPTGETVRLAGANLSLLVRGTAGKVAERLLTPTAGGLDGLVPVRFEPDCFLIGSSGFGLRLEEGLVFDFSSSAAAGGQTIIDGHVERTPADDNMWQGLVARSAELYLPGSIPLFSDAPLQAALAVGQSPTPGVDLILDLHRPAAGNRPEVHGRLECRDPTATGVEGLVPTLLELETKIPLNGPQGAGGASVTVEAPEPMTARLRIARAPAALPPSVSVSISLDGGETGLLIINAKTGGVPERAALAAGVLATALIADGKASKDKVPGSDQSGVYLHLLLTAAMALSAFLKQDGRLVLNGVELDATGEGLAPTERFALAIDYSVDAIVTTFGVGVLSVSMNPDQPMRVRVRNVVLRIDRRKTGLGMINLDFDHADLELEDPGDWKVEGPASLFNVLGTRSGRGSMWIEVDLGFALNLGPVKVSGATIRATVGSTGTLQAELRGLDASLDLPGVISGRGKVQMLESGFDAELAVGIVPLNLAAAAKIAVDQDMVALALGVDLPGPIPLANTGLALFGVAGAFAANGVPKLKQDVDIITRQIAWSALTDGFARRSGDTTFGFEAVIGTAPDMGFTMSAKGGLFLTLPDFALRAGLSAKLFSPRLKVTDRPAPPDAGLAFTGVAVIDGDGVTIGLKGTYIIPHVLELVVPFGAHFPRTTNDWFIYLGADGALRENREMGPIRAVVLPDIVNTHGDVFLMLRGAGIHAFGPKNWNVDGGFVIAFGFGFEFVLGVRGIIWADISASAAILFATDPLLFAGYGQVRGGLHLGPVTLSVGAELLFKRVEGQSNYLFARICGKVDLLFFELEGCVDVSVGSEHDAVVPLPTQHPLDRREGELFVPNVALVDDHYHQVGALAAKPEDAATVWPDSIISLIFGAPPLLKAGVAPQFPRVEGTYGQRARRIGSEVLNYQWSLDSLQLVDCTDDPLGGTLVGGPFSATWQEGKFGDPNTSAEPAELALLTPEGSLWLHRTAEGARESPFDPSKARATICQRRREPIPGWALALEGVVVGGALRLRPEAFSQDPAQSQVSGLVIPMVGGFRAIVPFEPGQANALPPPLSFVAGGRRAFGSPLEAERKFEGWWSPGTVRAPIPIDEGRLGRVLWFQSMVIRLDDPVTQGRAWLLIKGAPAADSIEVEEQDRNPQVQWALTNEIRIDEDTRALEFSAPNADFVGALLVRWPIDLDAGLIGVRGITASAASAVAAQNSAAAAEAADAAAAASAGPVTASNPPSPVSRCVLQPGRIYRIDLDFSWTGTLVDHDDKGNETKITGGGTDYLPPGAPAAVASRRQYWFRTAALEHDRFGAGARFGSPTRLGLVHRSHELFDPAMLERHLIGYEPGQTAVDRFRDDPLNAHFDVSHVAALAKAYGYSLKLSVQRTDAPGKTGLAKLISPQFGFITAPDQLMIPARLLHEDALAGPCEVPGQGLTATVDPRLAPRSWYELSVVAETDDPDVRESGKLPGVTFRTSRWLGPRDMMNALGFPRLGFGLATGDVAVSAVPVFSTPSAPGDDAALESALTALGMESWPLAAEPRVSMLWTGAGPQDWRLAGVLIESPEPIHRPGRLQLKQLEGPPGSGFALKRSDRSGSRLLFGVSTPFRPVTGAGGRPPYARLRMLDVPGSVDLTGRLRLPLAPLFEGEA